MRQAEQVERVEDRSALLAQEAVAVRLAGRRGPGRALRERGEDDRRVVWRLDALVAVGGRERGREERVERQLPGEDDVAGGQRLAVAPARAAAEPEGGLELAQVALADQARAAGLDGRDRLGQVGVGLAALVDPDELAHEQVRDQPVGVGDAAPALAARRGGQRRRLDGQPEDDRAGRAAARPHRRRGRSEERPQGRARARAAEAERGRGGQPADDPPTRHSPHARRR